MMILPCGDILLPGISEKRISSSKRDERNLVFFKGGGRHPYLQLVSANACSLGVFVLFLPMRALTSLPEQEQTLNLKTYAKTC